MPKKYRRNASVVTKTILNMSFVNMQRTLFHVDKTYKKTNRKGEECPAYQMSHNRWHGYDWRRVDKINSIA